MELQILDGSLIPVAGIMLSLAVVVAVSLHKRCRDDKAFWDMLALIQEHQYRDAHRSEIDAFMTFARRRGLGRDVEMQMLAILALNDGRIRHGHLWFLAWRIHGILPAHAQPPSCAKGGIGLEQFTNVPCSATRKGWQ